jgi:hypothetical protein
LQLLPASFLHWFWGVIYMGTIRVRLLGSYWSRVRANERIKVKIFWWLWIPFYPKTNGEVLILECSRLSMIRTMMCQWLEEILWVFFDFLKTKEMAK